MKLFPLTLIIFGIILIVFPEIIAYLLWGFFVFIGINMILITAPFWKKKSGDDEFIKFGKYKIYR